MPLGPPPHGMAGGDDGLRPALHARPRERRLGRVARRRRRRAGGGRGGRRIRPLGMRALPRLPPLGRELLRAPGRDRRLRRRARPRRRDGRVHVDPPLAAASAARRPRSSRCRPPLRRGAHPVPRDQALAAPARAGLDGGRDRSRRARPHGGADPSRAQPGPGDRRRHLRREARPGARDRRRRDGRVGRGRRRANSRADGRARRRARPR